MKSLKAWSNILRSSLIVCLRAVHFSAVDDFLSKVIMMTCALAVKASVTFNYSSPVQDHPHSKNQSKAYQVQMKHNALIFYVLRFSFLEQYFNVWHTVLKYLEPFFFNFLILRCLNGLSSPPLRLNNYKVFQAWRNARKKGILFVKKVRKMKQRKHQNKR